MRSCGAAGYEDGPASADAAPWTRLDILVEAAVAGRLPAMVGALRAAGHRVRVAATGAHGGAFVGDDQPDVIVAEAAGAAGLGAVVGQADQVIPVFSADRVQAALESGRLDDLLGPFDLGRMA